jgi:hypothetical protein
MSTDRLTEILNYLSAMSRDIGAFRAEVNARFDTVEPRVGNIEMQLREVRTDIRLMNRKFDVVAKGFMDLQAYQLDLEKRTETLERKAGITDPV